MSDNFSELFAQSLETVELNVGQVITGVVMGINHERVLVHVGLKSEGAVPLDQFRSDGEDNVPQLGDEVQVMLEAIDDGRGNTVLSREKARAHKVWQKLTDAYEQKLTVKGVISNKVRGGFIVDVDVVKCFLPGSLLDTQPLKDTTHLENCELEFRVIRVEEDRNNVVLSRRALLKEQTQEERDVLFNKLVEGEVRTGVVKNMTDYGVFVDLGGIDGLLHITDMSWRRLGHPEDGVSISDEIQVKVLKVDVENQRVSLGLKQLENNPWEGLEQRYHKGSRLEVSVLQVMEYGCFAEVEPGIEGLIHISEMSWTTQSEHPSRSAKVGDKVQVEVLEMDVGRQRISLSMKRCTENPWELFSQKHSSGEHLKGKISSITDFGLFVDLGENVTGMVHVSDLSDEESKEPEEILLRQYSRDDEVDVVLLSMDPSRQRIALSISQVNNPLNQYLVDNPEGSDVTGVIEKVGTRAITLKLADKIIGLVRATDIDQQFDDIREHYQSGAEVKGRIVGVDSKRKRVLISIKSYVEDTERTAVKDYRQQQAKKYSKDADNNDEGSATKDQVKTSKE